MKRIPTTVVLGVLLALLALGCSQDGPFETPSASGPMALTATTGGLGVVCDGNETLCDIGIALEPGTDIIGAGVGLVAGQPGNISISVPGTVKQVILFWNGFHLSGADVPDDQIMVGGQNVTGVLVGPNHEFFGGAWTSVYRKDITGLGLVNSGPNTIAVQGMDYTRRNNGAGILVIYDDGGDLATIGVKEGNDAAFHAFTPPLDTTAPQTYTFPAAGQDRTATLYLFAGSVAEGRPNVVEVTSGASLERFIDKLDNGDGDEFDTQRLDVLVPAGETSLTVQCLSEKDASSQLADDRPASLVWLVGGLSVPSLIEPGCRVTGGMDEKPDDQVTYNTYTSGGQAGAPNSFEPMPYGEWTHTNHKGPDGHFTFHAGTNSAPPGTKIVWIDCTDPGWCVQARPAPAKQIDFAGIGSFRNGGNTSPPAIQQAAKDKSLHWFEVNIDDLGEPAKNGIQQPASPACPLDGFGRRGAKELADCDCPDFYRIRIHATDDPGSGVIYEESGYLTKGNYQIHPPLSK